MGQPDVIYGFCPDCEGNDKIHLGLHQNNKLKTFWRHRRFAKHTRGNTNSFKCNRCNKSYKQAREYRKHPCFRTNGITNFSTYTLVEENTSMYNTIAKLKPHEIHDLAREDNLALPNLVGTCPQIFNGSLMK